MVKSKSSVPPEQRRVSERLAQKTKSVPAETKKKAVAKKGPKVKKAKTAENGNKAEEPKTPEKATEAK